MSTGQFPHLYRDLYENGRFKSKLNDWQVLSKAIWNREALGLIGPGAYCQHFSMQKLANIGQFLRQEVLKF